MTSQTSRRLKAMANAQAERMSCVKDQVNDPPAPYEIPKGLRGTPPGGGPGLDVLDGQSIDAFRASGLVVIVRSALLGEEIVFAADGTPTSLKGGDEKGRVVYRGEELRFLVSLAERPEELVAYHTLKKNAGLGTVDRVFVEPEPTAMEESA